MHIINAQEEAHALQKGFKAPSDANGLGYIPKQ